MPYKNYEDRLERSKQYAINNIEANRKRSSEWYYNNKERSNKRNVENHRLRSNRLRVENPEKFIWERVRNSARTRKIFFDLTVDDIVIPEYCPILGLKLEINTGKLQKNSPSVDRIDNSRGYTKDNVRVISHEANRMKSNLTLDVLKKLIDYVSE